MRQWTLALLLVPALAAAQTNPAAQGARQWRQQHERAILDEFMALLAVPNVSSDKPNIQRNAELVAKMVAARGIAAKLVSVQGGKVRLGVAAPPAVRVDRREIRDLREQAADAVQPDAEQT